MWIVKDWMWILSYSLEPIDILYSPLIQVIAQLATGNRLFCDDGNLISEGTVTVLERGGAASHIMTPITASNRSDIPTVLHDTVIAYPSADSSTGFITLDGSDIVTVGNEELTGRIHVTSYNTCHILTRTGDICLVTHTWDINKTRTGAYTHNTYIRITADGAAAVKNQILDGSATRNGSENTKAVRWNLPSKVPW